MHFVDAVQSAGAEELLAIEMDTVPEDPQVIALGADPNAGSGWDEECAFLILDHDALRQRFRERDPREE
jgi:hypothetical protein